MEAIMTAGVTHGAILITGQDGPVLSVIITEALGITDGVVEWV